MVIFFYHCCIQILAQKAGFEAKGKSFCSKNYLAMLSLDCHIAKLTYSTRRCQMRSQDISFLPVYIDCSHALQVFTLLTWGFHFSFYMYINCCGRTCALGG